MTSLGRVGRILAGTIDVTNSIADKDTHSTNASTTDCNAMMAATTSNAATTTMSSMANDPASSERKARSSVSCNLNDSSTSSNDNTSNNAMTLQGKRKCLRNSIIQAQ